MEEEGFEQIEHNNPEVDEEEDGEEDEEEDEGKVDFNDDDDFDDLLYRRIQDEDSKDMDNLELAQAQANARPTTEEEICKICYENNISCVFVPCGHFCTCLACGTRLDNCCICRVRVEIAQKVFRS